MTASIVSGSPSRKLARAGMPALFTSRCTCGWRSSTRDAVVSTAARSATSQSSYSPSISSASALYQRTHTGRGQFVDVAMLDAALAFIPGPVSEYTVAGIEARQIGNGSVSRKPTASRFQARDGYLVLAVLTEKQFASLMRTLGCAD